MSKKKSAYIDYSMEQVQKMEGEYFVLQMGGDFILEDDFYLFTKEEAELLYESTMKDLVSVVHDGTEKDKRYALDLICGLAIRPMRLH